MHLGIDLGTTYCCVAYIDENGQAQVIRSSEGETTTPSVIWFDGNRVKVGKVANDLKMVSKHHIKEFIKRDMGKPVESNSPDEATAPYEVNGFKYGAVGMAAMILRKLKKDALRYVKQKGLVDRNLDEKSYKPEVIITVPAYFDRLEREATRLAGQLAGLQVSELINEPTAAAITYGLLTMESKTIMVFDLGGGTLDITILHVNNDQAAVVASDGWDQLGGKDWDETIQNYLAEAYYAKFNNYIPDEMGFEIQKKALQAKHELSEREETQISLSTVDGDLEVTLYRSAPKNDSALQFVMEEDRPFYFNERADHLISRCQSFLFRVLEKTGMNWQDIDEIVLAGGSCQMPMITEMLEQASGRQIKKQINGFNFNTAIAIGAAHYAHMIGQVQDVVGHSLGIKCEVNGREVVDHLILKNTPLPARAIRKYTAVDSATLWVYSGEEERPDECTPQGRLELNNPAGEVTIILDVDRSGIVHVAADYLPVGQQSMEIKTDNLVFNSGWIQQLGNHVLSFPLD